MKNKITYWGFIDAAGVSAYVMLIATLMTHLSKIFGPKDSFFAPVAFLLLFVTSASITGTLVLGRPIWLYLDGQKKEAAKLLVYTILWLLAFTFVALLANFIK